MIHQSHTGSSIDEGKGCNQSGQINQRTEGTKREIKGNPDEKERER